MTDLSGHSLAELKDIVHRTRWNEPGDELGEAAMQEIAARARKHIADRKHLTSVAAYDKLVPSTLTSEARRPAVSNATSTRAILAKGVTTA